MQIDPSTYLAFQYLLSRYARAVDRRDYVSLGSLFWEDAEMWIPHLETRYSGREQIVQGIQGIEMFESTYHEVHTPLCELEGEDSASGESYCVAMHFSTDPQGKRQRYDMGIRYLDVWRKKNDSWLFAKRELVLDWEHTISIA